MKFTNILLWVILLLLIVLMFTLSIACEDSPIAAITSGRITMTSQYSSVDPFNNIVPKNVAAGIMSIDSIRITRARFVLHDITYRTRYDSSNFHAEPFVLELNLSNTIQSISISEVPFGSYDKIEFDVYRTDTNNVKVLPLSEQVQFRNFAAGEGYSIIISGKIYIGGQSIVFTFRSGINVKQKIVLSQEIVVSESSPEINATMFINSSRWFRSSLGDLMDPSDVLNETMISDNVCASINVFKDNNKDGRNDAN